MTKDTTSLKAVEEPTLMRTRRQEIIVETATAVKGMEARLSTWIERLFDQFREGSELMTYLT